MRASFLSAWVVGAVLALPALAHAQVVHAGLDAARVAPAALVRTGVTVPAAADVPVRLSFAPAQGAPNELLVGVLVARDAHGARAALDRFVQGFETEVPRDAAFGDVSVHPGDALVAFARDNVLVWVRRIAGTHDVAALAHALDAAVRAAPVGPPLATAARVQVGARTSLRGGRESLVALAVSGDVLAAELRAVPGGPAPYHTSRGWFVRLRGAATVTPADVVARAVDSHLRVTP